MCEKNESKLNFGLYETTVVEKSWKFAIRDVAKRIIVKHGKTKIKKKKTFTLFL